MPQTEISLVIEFAGIEQDHQIGTAGEWLPDSRFILEQAQCGRERCRCDHLIVWNESSHDRSCSKAARLTASTMRAYPVQRQRFPARPSRICSSVGEEILSSRLTAARVMAGVQIPHCAAPCSRKAACTRASWSFVLRAGCV